MTVLIIGANGQLGSCLQDKLKSADQKYIAVDVNELDITNSTAIFDALLQFRPEAVVNAAAYTAVDKAESDASSSIAVNATGVGYLATACSKLAIPLVHVSTDYVFDGLKKSAYIESDTPNPSSVYGKTKLMGEDAIRSSGAQSLILRTAWLFSEYGHNFVKSMIRLASERDSISVVSDQKGCPTYAGDLACAIVSVLPRLRDGKKSVIYHYAGGPACSWFQFAASIFDEAERIGLVASKPYLIEISSAEYPTVAKRPANSILDCSAFAKSFGRKPDPWINGVREVLGKLSIKDR